jgi:hypothetical protein
MTAIEPFHRLLFFCNKIPNFIFPLAGIKKKVYPQFRGKFVLGNFDDCSLLADLSIRNIRYLSLPLKKI